jgi:trehalose 6-phosphate phosphatase
MGVKINKYSSTAALQRVLDADKLRLFLDYDGTLADFAPTPDEIYPDAELIDLLSRLNNHPRFQLAIISGRRLSHIRKLIPIQGLLLAGTYGIELQDSSGTKINRLDFDEIRPALDRIKPAWLEYIRPHQEFYLEDKGWTLALHAKFVDGDTAQEIIDRCRLVVEQMNLPGELFRVLGGNKFLEVAPTLANKGLTVRYLLSKDPLEGAFPVYIGDDDKDEEAFEVILQYDGVAIKVDSQPGDTVAQMHFDTPDSIRQFLSSLI